MTIYGTNEDLKVPPILDACLRHAEPAPARLKQGRDEH